MRCCSPRAVGGGPKRGVAAFAAHQAAAHEDKRRRHPTQDGLTPPSPFEAASDQVSNQTLLPAGSAWKWGSRAINLYHVACAANASVLAGCVTRTTAGNAIILSPDMHSMAMTHLHCYLNHDSHS